MNWNKIKSIYRKELKEIIRDKRMLFLIILLPFFLYPALFFVFGSVGKSQQNKMSSQRVELLISSAVSENPVVRILKENDAFDVTFKEFTPDEIDTMDNAIGLDIQPGESYNGFQNFVAKLYVDDSKDLLQNRKRSIQQIFHSFNENIIQQRLASQGIDPGFIKPYTLEVFALADQKVKVGKAIGRFIPIMILLFIFMGSIYIAIDITAGEKERKTLQTLFTAPVETADIIAAKFLAVSTIAIISGFMNLMSLIVAVYIQISLMGAGDIFGVSLSIGLSGYLFLIVIILLSTVFISALSLAVVLLANSYKEAQSYVSPLMLLILIPAVISMMPGMELNSSTAFVPVLNISLAMGSIFAGSAETNLMFIVIGFLLLYSFLALFFATKTFNNESVITGEKVNWKSILKS